MNSQIIKLFGFIVVLFALLVVFTTRWTVISASALNANHLNHRTVIAQLKIKRGRIEADNGQTLAESVPKGGGTWGRSYPQGTLYAQTVGYWRGEDDDAGLELSDNSYLTGAKTSQLSAVFGPLGGNPVGDDVVTTLDPKAQQLAEQELAGRAGSVIALDPSTGAILAMYSNPTYNSNDPNAPCSDACQYDRATEGQYPPGSTFKIVTMTAALDSGKFTPNSTLNGDSPLTVSGVPLENDGNESYGEINLTTALTYSVNTVFAQLGQDVGRSTMTKYMKRFGFYAKPPIDLPSGELETSKPVAPDGKPYPPGSPDEDIGRIAFGQGGLEVTPLQMAMVVSAVADGGKLMRPHLTDRVLNAQGQTVVTIQPQLYSDVMSSTVAGEIGQMMTKVVDEGTGTPAQLGNIPFAGKTGTASIGPAGADETQPWFVGFAPVNAPKVAVAVDIEKTIGGYGGQVAAPIARDIVKLLLSEGK